MNDFAKYYLEELKKRAVMPNMVTCVISEKRNGMSSMAIRLIEVLERGEQ